MQNYIKIQIIINIFARHQVYLQDKVSTFTHSQSSITL